MVGPLSERTRIAAALAPVLVGYHLLVQIGAAIILWLWRPLPVDAPGKFGALVILPVALAGFIASISKRGEVEHPAEVSGAGVAPPAG